MDIKYLLSEFEGRISRKSFWIGILAIIVVALALSFVLNLIFSPTLAQLLGFVILVYPASAIYTKRLHDRNKPTMPWLAILLAPSLLMTVMQFIGVGFETYTVNDQVVNAPTGMVGLAILTITILVGLWALVELGFLKGTKGSNDFGPDPLSE